MVVGLDAGGLLRGRRRARGGDRWLIVTAAGWLERLVCVPAALLLLYLAPVTVTAGICLLLVAVVINLSAAAQYECRPHPAAPVRGRPEEGPVT